MTLPWGKYRGRDVSMDGALLQLTPPADLAREVADLIANDYRTRSRRLHPDHGGDHRAMQRLNAARDWCRTAGLAGVAVTS